MTKNTRKVVIIASRELGFARSGVGKYILSYVPYIKQAGYSVDFLFQPSQYGLVLGMLWRIFILPRILSKKYNDYIKIFYDESFLISLRDCFINSSIAICHHTYKIPINGVFDLPGILVLYVGFNFFLKKVSHIIAVSNATKDIIHQFSRNAGCPVDVVPNTFDTKIKRVNLSICQYFSLPVNKKIILLIASTGTRKNVITSLKLLKSLPGDYILVRIGAIGNTKQDVEIANFLHQNPDLNKRYFVFSNLTEDELTAFYQQSYCLISPSLYEGFGRSVIEAQINCLPVISTVKGGLNEVVGDSVLIVNDPLNLNEWLLRFRELELIDVDFLIAKGKQNAQRFDIVNNYTKFLSVLSRF